MSDILKQSFIAAGHPLSTCSELWIWNDKYVLDELKEQAAHFYMQLWGDPQIAASSIAIPSGIAIQHANEAASIILQFKEKYNRTFKDDRKVDIKKVAEIRGSRFNTGKLRMDLIDPIALCGLAAVLTKGAEKYTAHNWRDGLPYMETIASMMRHISAIMSNQDFDDETGLYHADHLLCNAMFLSNMMKTRPDMDDRWKPKTVANPKPDSWPEAARKAFPETE